MQIVTHAGLPQPSQPPSQGEQRPAPAGFAAMLGALFAAVPVDLTPAAAGNSGAPDRPAARDVPDAIRPGDVGARQVPARDEGAPAAATDRKIDRSAQADKPRTPDAPASRPSDSRPTDRPSPVAESAGRANRDQGPDSSNAPAASVSPKPLPEASAVPASPVVAMPEVTAPVIVVMAVAVAPVVAAKPSQDFETVPGPGEQLAPAVDAPASAGNVAAAAPGSPAPSEPVVPPVPAAGDASVSPAPTPTAADSQVAPVTASGPQAGQAAPVLRTAKPEGTLAPSSVERVAAAVKAQAALGGGRVKILLNPPHLGTLRIEVAVRNSVVYARMEADSQAAQHSLQQHMTDLRKSLDDQGLSLGQVSVSVSHGDGNGSQAPFASAPSLFPLEAEPEHIPDSRPEVRLPRLLDVTV